MWLGLIGGALALFVAICLFRREGKWPKFCEQTNNEQQYGSEANDKGIGLLQIEKGAQAS